MNMGSEAPFVPFSSGGAGVGAGFDVGGQSRGLQRERSLCVVLHGERIEFGFDDLIIGEKLGRGPRSIAYKYVCACVRACCECLFVRLFESAGER